MNSPKPSLAAYELLLNIIADENRSQGESRPGQRCPASFSVRGKWKKMKAIFIEPFLVAASSLLWIFVLPFAALVCSGIAISDRVEGLKACQSGASWKQPEMRAAARPTSPT